MQIKQDKLEKLTKFHVCVLIDRALEELAKGNNLFKCSDLDALNALIQAKDQGKKYYSGCDNMNKEGKCAGHDTK